MTAWIIESWSDDGDAALAALREPPMYLEIDFIADAESPVAVVVEPDYLREVDPEQKFMTALDRIVAAFGTDDPEADFSFDGSVDAEDLAVALQLLGLAESG